MSRPLLIGSAAIAALLMAAGLVLLDLPVVQWIHHSAVENASIFVTGLPVLDTALGMHISYWLAPAVCLALGLIALLLSRRTRLPHRLGLAIACAALVQGATIALMMIGKNLFGRARPLQLIESADWSTIWFAGGGSFPSGHGAFYFGLFLPLAAAAPRAWQRVLLLCFPVFAILARLDTHKHFLSDVAASALIAACMALLARSLLNDRTLLR